MNYTPSNNSNFYENVRHIGKNNCHLILTSSTMNSTEFNFGENDHLCRNRDGNNHQLYQNKNPVMGAFNCHNIATDDDSHNYLVNGDNDHIRRNRDGNNHQYFQSKNFAIGKFNCRNITTDDNSQNYLVTGENDHFCTNRDGNNYQLYQSKNFVTNKFNRHSLATYDNGQNYMVPGEHVSSHRDDKNHQSYQSYKLVGDEYHRLNVASDNSQNSFKGDESNHLIRTTPKDPRRFRVERKNKKIDFSRNNRNKKNCNTVHNLNWNRNQGTLNAEDPSNNNCHSPAVNTSN